MIHNNDVNPNIQDLNKYLAIHLMEFTSPPATSRADWIDSLGNQIDYWNPQEDIEDAFRVVAAMEEHVYMQHNMTSFSLKKTYDGLWRACFYYPSGRKEAHSMLPARAICLAAVDVLVGFHDR